MGILSNFFSGLAIGQCRREIERSLEVLKGMDDCEVEMFYNQVMFTKGLLNKHYGIVLGDPFLSVKLDDNISIKLNADIQNIRKQEGPLAVAGMTFWLYTIRAVISPELRYLVKQIWKELARGMPTGEEWFPEGFVPNEISISNTRKEELNKEIHQTLEDGLKNMQYEKLINNTVKYNRNEEKICPHCHKFIPILAKACMHCGKWMPGLEPDN